MNCPYCARKLKSKSTFMEDHYGKSNKKRLSYKCHSCKLTFYGETYETLKPTKKNKRSVQRVINIIKGGPIIRSMGPQINKNVYDRAIELMAEDGLKVEQREIRRLDGTKYTMVYYLKEHREMAEQLIDDFCYTKRVDPA